MASIEKCYYVRFKRVNRKKLGDLIRKINEVLSDKKSKNTAGTNNMINATNAFVSKKLCQDLVVINKNRGEEYSIDEKTYEHPGTKNER